MIATEMIDISIDTEMLDASISSYFMKTSSPALRVSHVLLALLLNDVSLMVPILLPM